ncbi:MAG: CYTH domain-containing protein [Anaerovoracaceae bacterium]|jgi:uncharacterized protein YjbK
MDQMVGSHKEQKAELEIEYKAMLTQERYEELLEQFSKFANLEASYTQTNYYFDTGDHLLINQGVTVRLRNIGDSWEFQVKIPNESTGQFNSQTEYVSEVPGLLASDFIHNGIVKYNQLLKNIAILEGVDVEGLQVIGKLETIRQDFCFYTDTISLDKNSYLDVVDYELEWETTNHHYVLYMFEHFKLEPTKNVGKVTRFLDRLNRERS